MERKMKSQKAKSKSSEGRKQLSNVRVIRRNLVYIVGLPLDLADEDVIFLLHLLPVVMPFYFSPCSKWKIYFLIDIHAASPAARVFWSIWEGLKSLNVSNGSWCCSAVSEQYM